MEYLSYEEFKSIGGSDEVTESDFNKLLPVASSLLDIYTNNFYHFNDLETDAFQFRKLRFKQALAAQIGHFKEAGSTTAFGIDNRPSSFTVGRTRVDYGGGGTSADSKGSSESFSQESFLLLEGTGLLYRGVE